MAEPTVEVRIDVLEILLSEFGAQIPVAEATVETLMVALDVRRAIEEAKDRG